MGSTEKMKHFERRLKIPHCKTAHVCAFKRLCLKVRTTRAGRFEARWTRSGSQNSLLLFETKVKLFITLQLKYRSVQFFNIMAGKSTMQHPQS